MGLGFLGLTLDETKNRAGGEGDISAAGSFVRTLVIPTDEEGEIARGDARAAPRREGAKLTLDWGMSVTSKNIYKNEHRETS